VTYRRALVGRWSRRDRLAVFVVAAIVALLVGSALVVLTAGAETTRLAADINASGSATLYDDPAAARANARSGDVVAPLARVTVRDRRVTLVGLPPDAEDVSGFEAATPPDGRVLGLPGATDEAVESGTRVTIVGDAETVTRTARSRRDTGSIPPWWSLVSVETVETVGPTGAVVVSPGETTVEELRGLPPDDAPLVSVFAFFVAGTDQLVGGLGALTLGTAVFVVVVVFNVTRMTVRDRLRTLAVLRATGLPARRLLALFGVRSGMLAGVAVLVGAAAGVVLTNAAVNAAVFLGVPTTLSLRVTPAVLAVLAPALLVVWLVGVLAGIAATLPSVRVPPATLDRRARRGPVQHRPDRRLFSRLRPDLLPVNAVVPTAATLTVFVGVALVATTTAGVVAPLEGDSTGTVLQDGADHPWASRVEADYPRALRAEGIPASGEVYVFSVVDGRPFFTRGANYSAFANVSDAELTAGRPPDGPGEAVVGRDLAEASDIGIGDRLLLGGSDRSAFARVRVVGRYRAPGVFDDQLVVPLRTARHLSHVRAGDVNVVRFASVPGSDNPADGTPTPASARTGFAVTDLSVPAQLRASETLTVGVVVTNPGQAPVTRTLTVTAGSTSASREVSVDPGQRRTVEVSLCTLDPGTYTVGTGNLSRQVTVVEGRPLTLSPLPDRGPPNAMLRVRATDSSGEAVPNATVTTGEASAETGPDGYATVRLPGPGEAAVSAVTPGYAPTTATVRVVEGVDRLPAGRITVTPSRTSLVDPPSVTVTVSNPWNRTLTRTVEVGRERWTVTLAPGERVERTTTLPRTGTGTQRVHATADGAVFARTTYEVTGDERVVSALATGGYRVASSGLGQAASNALGNLRVLLGTLVGLAALTTVAATTAAFARTVYARRRTVGVYRATGATPRQVFAMVFADAARIALVATVIALIAGFAVTWALARAGVLSAFGVALVPAVSPVALLATGAVALALALLGAAVATAGLVRAAPGTLFVDAAGPPDSRGTPDLEGGTGDG
jgi:ABC-type lipoprotein release transport system permease subunit